MSTLPNQAGPVWVRISVGKVVDAGLRQYRHACKPQKLIIVVIQGKGALYYPSFCMYRSDYAMFS